MSLIDILMMWSVLSECFILIICHNPDHVLAVPVMGRLCHLNAI
jgi:hypothetical protein